MMPQMHEALDQLQSDACRDLEAVATADELEAWRIDYLGSRGRLKQLMPAMKDVDASDRPKVGQRLNEVKTTLETAFAEHLAGLDGATPVPAMDVTEPGIEQGLGRRHVTSRTMDEVTDVFGRMGFSVAFGPEIEDEHHNFDALNIPSSHPARDPRDNFFMDAGRMLRAQTSTVQVRVMEATQPPLRVITVGRVYRPDTHDATHYSMFHQCEGLYVDHEVSMVDLKSTLVQFARAYFGEDAEIRFRPSYFPFTEPSAEVDMRMQVRGEMRWVEMGGCGLVDPAVFEQVGYDPDQWQGYAFGLGIDRIAMLKYGISDIRMLFENDARFLRQF